VRGVWSTPAGPNLDFPEFQTELLAGEQGATIFIGDSITELYKQAFAGGAAWSQFQSAGIKPVNFAIAGDTIENMLFRYNLYNGRTQFADGSTLSLFQALNPRMFVLMMGTNNFNIDSEQIAQATLNFADLIHQDFPCASVVVVGIPPNTLGQGTPAERNAVLFDANTRSEQLVGEIDSLVPPCLGSVDFHGVWDPFFVNSDPGGLVNDDLYIDGLHPNPNGYSVWLGTGGLLNKLTTTYFQCSA